MIESTFKWAKEKVTLAAGTMSWLVVAVSSKYGFWAGVAVVAVYVLLAGTVGLAVFRFFRRRADRKAWRARKGTVASVQDALTEAGVGRSMVVEGTGWIEVLVPRGSRQLAATALAVTIPNGIRYRVLDLPVWRCRLVPHVVENQQKGA